MSLSTPSTPAPVVVKANLWQSMALGGAAASFAVNFTHPIVRDVTHTFLLTFLLFRVEFILVQTRKSHFNYLMYKIS